MKTALLIIFIILFSLINISCGNAKKTRYQLDTGVICKFSVKDNCGLFLSGCSDNAVYRCQHNVKEFYE